MTPRTLTGTGHLGGVDALGTEYVGSDQPDDRHLRCRAGVPPDDQTKRQRFEPVRKDTHALAVVSQTLIW
jgi:hypothetical protein